MSSRDAYLRKKYGITQKTYLVMLKAQGGACFICRNTPRDSARWMAVDHNHKTGQVRGILCWRCNNKFLGRYRENPEMHKRAVEYLTSTYDWRDHPTAKKASHVAPSRKTA